MVFCRSRLIPRELRLSLGLLASWLPESGEGTAGTGMNCRYGSDTTSRCLPGCLAVLACPLPLCPTTAGTAATAMSEAGSLHGLPVTADSLDASNTASSKFSDALEGSENSGWMFLRGRGVLLGVVLTAGDGLGLAVCWWGVRGAKRVLGVSCWEGVLEVARCLVFRVEGRELAET